MLSWRFVIAQEVHIGSGYTGILDFGKAYFKIFTDR